MNSPHIFRANDIRGLWNKDFDLSFTKELAYALALLSKKNKIQKPRFLVGHDARLSSPSIAQALVQHLKEQGIQTAGIGLAPSPLCYFLLNHYKLSACIVVTASHNPKEFNGFKIVFHKKYKILDPISSLKKIVLQKRRIKKVYTVKGSSFSIEKEKAYLDSLKKEFQIKKTSFVVDTGHGALGPLAKKAFKSLGLKAKILFEKPDGRFPAHHPDPTIEENLRDLKQELKKGTYAFGLAFDGDGDRLVVVSKERRTVLGDEFAYLFLNSMQINKTKPALILADVKCSDWFFDFAKKEGLKVLMTKSGHGLMKAQIAKTGALFGVEFSGHIFFNDRKGRGFDDALYASLRLMELLNSKNKTLNSLLPKVSNARTGEIRLDMPSLELSKKLSKIRSYLKQRGESFKSIDGIRLSRKDSWALFRGSKTQSALSMRFEAETKEKLYRLKKEFSKVMSLSIA